MFQTLASSVPSLVVASVHATCEVIIKTEGILFRYGGIECTKGRTLDVPSAAEVCEVAVYPPVLAASATLV